MSGLFVAEQFDLWFFWDFTKALQKVGPFVLYFARDCDKMYSIYCCVNLIKGKDKTTIQRGGSRALEGEKR